MIHLTVFNGPKTSSSAGIKDTLSGSADLGAETELAVEGQKPKVVLQVKAITFGLIVGKVVF